MKKGIIISLLVGVVILVGFSAIHADEPNEIRIGACESATGMFSGFATGGIFGMKTAVADINKQGGIYIEKYKKKLQNDLESIEIRLSVSEGDIRRDTTIVRMKVFQI